MRTLLTLFILLAASVVAPSQTFDAEKSLKEVNDWCTSTLQSLTKEYEAASVKYGAPVIPFGDIERGVQRQRQSRAFALIGKIPPQKVPPKQSLAAAELYCYADLKSNKVAAARRFLTTKPDPASRYRAHQLLLQGYADLWDAAGLQSVLRVIKPSSTNEALRLMNEAASFFTRIIAAQLGSNAALEVLRRVESLAPLDALLKDKKEGDLAADVVANLAATRAGLLSSLGRTEEARRVLSDARSKARRPMDISTLDRAASKLEPAAPTESPKGPTPK